MYHRLVPWAKLYTDCTYMRNYGMNFVGLQILGDSRRISVFIYIFCIPFLYTQLFFLKLFCLILFVSFWLLYILYSFVTYLYYILLCEEWKWNKIFESESEPIHQPICQTINQWANSQIWHQHTNQSVNLATDQSIIYCNQSISYSINQPTAQ